MRDFCYTSKMPYQQLPLSIRIVANNVAVALNSKDGDLFRSVQEDNAESTTNDDPTGRINEGGKVGIFPCLEASMLVPGAAGPPIQLFCLKNRQFVKQRSRFLRFLSRREIN